MKKSSSILLILILLPMLGMEAIAQTNSNAIVGEWVNEKGDAKFKIYRKGDKYFGDITWGTGGPTKDVENPDPKKRNRDLVGLTILKDFEYESQNSWSSGTIYDPKDGKTYSCNLTLLNNTQLEVRGYIGISLFGRSEIWKRIN